MIIFLALLFAVVLGTHILLSGGSQLQQPIVQRELTIMKRSGSDKVFPDIVLNNTMSNDELSINFIKFVSTGHISCKTTERIGNKGDGGWDICLTKAFELHKPCLVYSFGIGNDFSFDDAVATRFNCTVRSFDPTMNVKPYKRETGVNFYDIGIGGDDHTTTAGWKLYTLTSIMNMFNDTKEVIDFLKMDVENSEWAVFDDVLKSGVLHKVKQIAFEIHVGRPNLGLYQNYLSKLKGLEDAGFRRWYYSMNRYNLEKKSFGYISCCYEMSYINMNFLPGWLALSEYFT